MDLKVILDGQEHGFQLAGDVDADTLRGNLEGATTGGGLVTFGEADRGTITLVGSHIAAYWLSEPKESYVLPRS